MVSIRINEGSVTAKVATIAPPYAACGGEPYICCRIDAYGTGGHLADGNNIRKFLRGEPPVAGDNFGLYHRKHGISASETEKPYFKEGIE